MNLFQEQVLQCVGNVWGVGAPALLLTGGVGVGRGIWRTANFGGLQKYGYPI